MFACDITRFHLKHTAFPQAHVIKYFVALSTNTEGKILISVSFKF